MILLEAVSDEIDGDCPPWKTPFKPESTAISGRERSEPLQKAKPKNFEPTELNGRRNQFNPGIAAWLLDHPVRPYRHIRRNRHADLLRGFQINHELKVCRLLHREIDGLGTF